MHLMSFDAIVSGLLHLSPLAVGNVALVAAEPASILYIVSGLIGLVFARLRSSSHPGNSSVLMLVCRRSMHERLHEHRLL